MGGVLDLKILSGQATLL